MNSARPRGTMLSLFSGAGGLDLGLERAGFDPVLCLDSDPAARATLRANRPCWLIPEDGDVSTEALRWTPKDLGFTSTELDLIAGGPPCQPFSKAAQWTPSGRIGLEDPRARALDGMIFLIDKFLPRAVLIENVPGFMSESAGAFSLLQERLSSINFRSGTKYSFRSWIVDAADYGIPQHRRRAIIVAFRDGQSFRLPTATHCGRGICAWDALQDYIEPDPPKPTGSWTDLLRSIPEGMNYQWLTARGGGAELFGWRTRFWSFLLKLARDRPSWTLPASPGPNTGPFHWENRPLSGRERLRLQSFPDEWVLRKPQREQWRMAGNATPPLLAEIVGREIAYQLGLGVDLAEQPTLAISSGSEVPPPTPPAPIPGRFASQVGPKLPHPGPGLGPSPRRQSVEATSEAA